MVNIYYYGERGLIDSLMLDIIQSDNKDEIVKNILNKLNPEISYKASFDIYVEPSFGQRDGFGVPDLIIKADDDLYIIEAKCGTVEKNCYTGTKTSEFWDKKNSSKLNVQLLLRYRFMNLLYNQKKNKLPLGKYFVLEEENEYSDSSHSTKVSGKFTYLRALSREKSEWIDQICGWKNVYYVALTSDLKKKDALDMLKDSYKVKFNVSIDDFIKNIRMLTYKDIIESLDNKTKYFDETCKKFGYYER